MLHYETFFGGNYTIVCDAVKICWRATPLTQLQQKVKMQFFFLHLIYGLDYYARARHIFHSSISFSSSKCLCCYNCIMYIQNVFIPVTKFQHCWNSWIGKKYIFRHEFGVLFGISNSLISLHFTWKSGQKSCQTSDFPTLCIYQEEQVLSM